jgi:prolyl oligopeptidase
MAARLQAATSSGLPVMLLYDTKAGHSGGRPFSKVVDELSLKLSFLAWQLGLNSAQSAPKSVRKQAAHD